jgi:hypothetical protein
VNDELFKEGAHYVIMINDLFLPCVDSQSGDFRTMPFPGSAADQPYMTMQALKIVQSEYKKTLAERRRKELQSIARRRPRR